MLNIQYLRIFCDVIFLLAPVFIVSFDKAYKEVSYKKILNIFCGSVFVIWLYLQKPIYRPCDLDLWPMKVNYFLWIDYRPISVLYKFQSDISTNSRAIKYQNIEKSPSLIIEWFVSMATKQIYLTNLKKKVSAMSWDENTSVRKRSGQSDQ